MDMSAVYAVWEWLGLCLATWLFCSAIEWLGRKGYPVSWTESLTSLIRDVAKGQSGQVGRFEFGPPDERVAVILSGGLSPDRSLIFVTTADPQGTEKAQTFTADQAAEAVSAYCAAVEGHS